jgi:hypothetical protein
MRPQVYFLVLASFLMPTFASADMIDRYRDATVAQATRMHAFMIARVPEIEAVLPSTEWTPELNAIATCTLDGIRAANGEDGVDAYVTALEAWSATEIRSMGTMADGMDPILGDALALQLAQDCGGMELAATQMRESGMIEMMSRPDVMERLMAE